MLFEKFLTLVLVSRIFNVCVSYLGCLDDIPDPLRELNDDFLQLPMSPAANGSDP
jgi:hypothetical protein